MYRKQMQEIFWEECKKLPNRRECRKLSKREILKISKEMDFDTLWEFLFCDKLGLTVDEIPKEIELNQIVLYLVLFENKKRVVCSFEIFQEDEISKSKIKELRTRFGIENDVLFLPKLKAFLDEMKSDRPDL